MNGSMTTARQIKKRTMGGHITIFRRQMDTVMDRATMDGQTSDNGWTDGQTQEDTVYLTIRHV